MKYKLTLLSFIVAMVATTKASADWEKVLEVNTPADGRYATTFRLRASSLKVVKEGEGCDRTAVNYQAIWRTATIPALEYVFNLLPAGRDGDGSVYYSLQPQNATIFAFNLATVRGGNCTYTFYAQ